MTLKIGEFAILAPVPIQHLDSAMELLTEKEYVAFGSMKFELFHEIELVLAGDRNPNNVPVLIYPSHGKEGEVDDEIPYEVSWKASYFELADTRDKMRFDEENGFRPKSTMVETEAANLPGGWGLYWRVKNLERLPEGRRIAIRDIKSYGRKYWRKDSPPRGPEIVQRPPRF